MTVPPAASPFSTLAAGRVGNDDDRRQSPPEVAVVDAEDFRHGGNYPGGKNGMGVWQSLINQMPPHDVYIEPFLGSGAILRRKKPACSSVGIDCDPRAIAAFPEFRVPGLSLVTRDARQCLAEYFGIRESTARWSGPRFKVQSHKKHLIYADPPYLGSTRGQRRRYECELMTEAEHRELLDILTSIPAMVMISGYRSELYDRVLANWRRVDRWVSTRGGMRKESTWMNYPEPVELHDYRFLGRDCHDRLRVRRKIARHIAKLRRLPAVERAAILHALNAVNGKERA